MLTREGFEDIKPLLFNNTAALWVNAGVLSDGEASALRLEGVSLTAFSNHIPAIAEHIADAVATIEEHHPGKRIWVESASATQPPA